VNSNSSHQSHQITPDAAIWNDSLQGDYLWSCFSLGEMMPDVMTPCTWSLMHLHLADTLATSTVGQHRSYGIIGGRLYTNVSMSATLYSAMGIKPEQFRTAAQQVFGPLPEGAEIPMMPLPKLQVLRTVMPSSFVVRRRVKANMKRLPQFLARAPQQCQELQASIRAASTPAALAEVWRKAVEPYFHTANRMLEAASQQGGPNLALLRVELAKLGGEAGADLVLSGIGTDQKSAFGIGPLVGLAQLAEGAIDQHTYIRLYGHRFEDEFEVAAPRPAEDPSWIDRQLAVLNRAGEDVAGILQRRAAERAETWKRMKDRRMGTAAKLEGQVEQWAAAVRCREAARSEVARTFAVLRAFVLRAGELTGHGEDLFFLTIQEILALLNGDAAALSLVPERRTAYEAYRALPRYPVLIRGRFDPFRWAAASDRRGDYYDASGKVLPAREEITGFSRSPAAAEGRVRVLASPEEGAALEPGEILVAPAVNTGWTPLFPLASAVVTDMGTALTDAAIAAWELGIPMLAGCGSATTQLRTGDLVRVDGKTGKVEVLEPAPQ